MISEVLNTILLMKGNLSKIDIIFRVLFSNVRIRRIVLPMIRIMTLIIIELISDGCIGKNLIKYNIPKTAKTTFIIELVIPVINTPVIPSPMDKLHNLLRIRGVAKYPERAGVISLNNCPAKLAKIVLFIEIVELNGFNDIYSESATKVEATMKNAEAKTKFNIFTVVRMENTLFKSAKDNNQSKMAIPIVN